MRKHCRGYNAARKKIFLLNIVDEIPVHFCRDIVVAIFKNFIINKTSRSVLFCSYKSLRVENVKERARIKMPTRLNK
jgi:hypothetical protein